MSGTLQASGRHQRVKNDRRDATNLAELLRMGRLPEAWIAPPELWELRELVRYRAKLVACARGSRAHVHAVLAKEGVHVPMTDPFGVAGNQLLDSLQLAPAFDARDGGPVEWSDCYGSADWFRVVQRSAYPAGVSPPRDEWGR